MEKHQNLILTEVFVTLSVSRVDIEEREQKRRIENKECTDCCTCRQCSDKKNKKNYGEYLKEIQTEE